MIITWGTPLSIKSNKCKYIITVCWLQYYLFVSYLKKILVVYYFYAINFWHYLSFSYLLCKCYGATLFFLKCSTHDLRSPPSVVKFVSQLLKILMLCHLLSDKNLDILISICRLLHSWAHCAKHLEVLRVDTVNSL